MISAINLDYVVRMEKDMNQMMMYGHSKVHMDSSADWIISSTMVHLLQNLLVLLINWIWDLITEVFIQIYLGHSQFHVLDKGSQIEDDNLV